MSSTPVLAALVSLAVALITSFTTFFVQKRRLRRQPDLQLGLQAEKLRKTTRIGRTMVLAAGLWVTLALMLALAASTLIPQVGAEEATPPDGVAAEREQPLGGRPVGETFLRTELYFGSGKPGPDVTKKQFDCFVDRKVTPRFPDGLSLLTGYGQFEGSDGKIVQERSFVLILLYPPGDEEANREIEEIRAAYERDFDQESVLRVDSRERVSF